MANNKPEQINIGTCRITYDGVDLGFTQGGVSVEVATSTHETKVDQFGETPVNETITGRTIMVKCPLAETTVENLAAIMPGAELVTDSTDPTKKKVNVKTSVGKSLYADAKKLVLHPIDLDDNDHSQDLVLPKANTPGGMTFDYMNDKERVYNADFKGYPDSDSILYIYGDETATA